jgi:hypothetical protein
MLEIRDCYFFVRTKLGQKGVKTGQNGQKQDKPRTENFEGIEMTVSWLGRK